MTISNFVSLPQREFQTKNISVIFFTVIGEKFCKSAVRQKIIGLTKNLQRSLLDDSVFTKQFGQVKKKSSKNEKVDFLEISAI